MRIEREIREKIEEYMNRLHQPMTSLEREGIYGIIDALLWVIGDESGKAI